MNILKFLAFLKGYITYIFQVPVKHYLSTDIVLITQNLRKKIRQGKTYFKGTSILLKKRCKISPQNLQKKADSSCGLRLLFECPSTLCRTSVASASGTLRLLFDCASGGSRSVLEALPKPSRRSAKPVSNMSRRSLEAEPKASRRGEEELPSSDFCLTNFAPTSTFHAIGIEFSSGFHRATPIKTRCGLDEKPMKCKNSAGIAQKMVEAFQQMGDGRLTYGVEFEQSVLRCFMSICKAFVLRANTLLGSVSLVVQRALKYFLFFADYKRAYRMVLTCLFLCLISMFSLSAQTPRKDSGADGLSEVKGLKVGDLVGDDFYSHMHKSVDWSSKAVSQTNLSLHRDKLIILDFWAPWCSPCLGSLKKLDSLKKTWDANKVVIIPVTTNGLKDITRTLNYFKWDYQSIYDDSYLSHRLIHQALPFMVWIKDGRVIATPKTSYATTENINAVLTDKKIEVFNKTEVKLIDTTKALFTKDNGLPDHVFYDSQGCKLVGYIPGYTEANFKVFKTRDSLTLYAVNSTIDRIYQEAYKDEIYPYQIKKKAIRWDVGIDFASYLEKSKPRENWTGDLHKDRQLEEWKRQHYLSIMVSVPRDSGISMARRKMQKLLADQVEQKFGLEAKIQDGETIRYPILKPIDTRRQAEIKLSQKLQRRRKKGYENYAVPFSDQPHFKLFIETALKNIKSLGLTDYRIWDRTGIAPDFPAKFSFPVDIAQERKFENIQNLLKQYGLQILIEEKPVPYLYISQSAVHSKSKGHENL